MIVGYRLRGGKGLFHGAVAGIARNGQRRKRVLFINFDLKAEVGEDGDLILGQFHDEIAGLVLGF